MMSRPLRHLALVAGFAVLALAPADALAGVDACGGMRLDADDECEVVGEGEDCTSECEQLSVARACVTSNREDCRSICTGDEPPPLTAACTEECDAICEVQCDEGIEVVCAHNCFDECAVACPGQCADAIDPEFCFAACEATCDGECAATCAQLAPGASCYDHCKECCRGSCAAQGTMECEMSCQEQSYSSCASSTRTSCTATCEQGLVQCDDELVTFGPAADACVDALQSDGIDVYDPDRIDAVDPAPGCGCRSSTPPTWAWLGCLALLGLGLRRRRR